MTTTETTGYAIEDAEQALWLGRVPAAWGDVVRSVDPEQVQDAASMVTAAGLGWTVEQHPLEANKPGRRHERQPRRAVGERVTNRWQMKHERYTQHQNREHGALHHRGQRVQPAA